MNSVSCGHDIVDLMSVCLCVGLDLVDAWVHTCPPACARVCVPALRRCIYMFVCT
eukprot:SAG31_NODE_348_length_17296_cov_5.089482_9_plen_55_part_00